MIRFLAIHRLAVIDQLELELGPGLTVLTGETGAGKSILVEAIGLLLGGRASGDLVRTGEEKATLQAVIETSDGRELIVRREILAQGRSRAFLDGELVTTSTLAETLRPLVDLHGQHEHQALLTPATQLMLLDRFGGLEDLQSAVAGHFASLTAARAERHALEDRQRDLADRVEMLGFQQHEIDKVRPLPGEDDALIAERSVVANAEKLGRLAADSYDALYDDDHAVLSRLRQVWRRVGELASLDPRFQPYLETRDLIQAPLEDLATFLRDYGSTLDRSPDRLQAIEDRLAALERLKRRYGPTLDDVLGRRVRIEEDLAALDPSSGRLDELRARETAATRRYVDAAQDLSRERSRAGPRLSRDLERQLTDLAMTGTRCEVRITSRPDPGSWSPTGMDDVELRLSPNPGEELRPLARIASGGELSRVMLAMKTLASTDVPGKTLVFDEVDAGIGGGVADVVGQRLQALSRDSQVLCITHLPQVAAYGATHVRVVKLIEGERTVTRVEMLSADSRVEELARMMAGRELTDRVRAGARDLLESRAGRKAKPQTKAKGESQVRSGPLTRQDTT